MQNGRSALVALLTLCVAGTAQAQTTEVATARQLAISGIDAVESGDCKKGEPMLERAEQLHHATVHLQYLARCRLAEGRLVAATEMWRQIIREGAPSGSSPAVMAAIGEATPELEKTLPRLASTTIRVAATYPSLDMRLDGTKLPAEIVGAPQVLDPGEHELVAQAPGFGKWSKKWTVAEGGSAEITIELATTSNGEASGAGEASESGGDHGTKASVLTPVGWVTASVGAASMIAGTVTLLTRNNRRSKLESNCPTNQTCPTSLYTQSSLDSAKESISTLTTASNVLLFGGGALLAGGVTLIVIGAKSGGDAPKTAVLAGAPNADAGFTVVGRF